MPTTVTVEQEDGLLVVRIPGAVARQLQVDAGDQLHQGHQVRTEHGYALSPLSEDDLHMLRVAGEAMVKYESTLRRLVDS
jgi:hypothetical protein